MHSLVFKAARQIRQRGLFETIGWARYRGYEAYREWRLGIDTRGFIARDELTANPDCVDYEPVDYRCLDTALRYLDRHHRGEVFLDYGCGKGRAVTLAATYPFRCVLGVEIAPPLAAAAEENLQRASRHFRCGDVQVVTADAAQYVLPAAVTAVFLFNPFQGPVMAAVAEQMRASLLRHPRKLTIVYMHPYQQANGFAACDWLTFRCELPAGAWRNDVKLLVYESA